MLLYLVINNTVKKYKVQKINNEFFSKLDKLSGQALHAKTLGFIHPSTRKYMSFNSDLPDVLKNIEFT